MINDSGKWTSIAETEARTASATGTTQLLEHAFLLLLFAGLVIGVLAVLRPFATAILFGTILAIAAWPLREFLLRRGLKRGLDATLLLLLALAVVVLPLKMPELCALVAVSDRSLHLCCAQFLGMSPTQYVLLRRLEAVRRALRDANSHIANVAEIAHRFGFAELERFSETYQATFGEAPLTTLQHVPRMRPSAP